MDNATSEEENLRIRKTYKKLSDQLNDDDYDENLMQENDNEANTLFSNVHKPREAICDAELLLKKMKINNQQAQKINTGLIEFNCEDFSEKLVSFIAEEQNNTVYNIFEVLGKFSQSVISTPPLFSPLYNCIDAQLSPRKKRERNIIKEKIGELKKPTLVDSSAAADKEATEIAERILNILYYAYKSKGSKPICYFSFVTNPDSFSETVENMFYVSVLAREGTIKISKDSDGLPVIEPISLKEAENVKRDSQYSQAIITIGKPDFENIVKSFKIKKAMITRKRK